MPRINGHRMPRLPPSSLLLTIAPAGLMLPLCPHPTPRHPNHFGGHMLCLPSLLLPGSVYAPLLLPFTLFSSSTSLRLASLVFLSFRAVLLPASFFLLPQHDDDDDVPTFQCGIKVSASARLSQIHKHIYTHSLTGRHTHTLPHTDTLTHS